MNTQKTKNGAGTQRKATDRRQTNIGRKHRTGSLPGYCCLASQCYLTEGRPLPTRFGVRRDVPSQSLTEPAAFQHECWALVLCWLPVSFQHAHWASALCWTQSKTNTGVQISLLLVRKPLLPGECYSSQLKGSQMSPQMLCPVSESPKLRE